MFAILPQSASGYILHPSSLPTQQTRGQLLMGVCYPAVIADGLRLRLISCSYPEQPEHELQEQVHEYQEDNSIQDRVYFRVLTSAFLTRPARYLFLEVLNISAMCACVHSHILIHSPFIIHNLFVFILINSLLFSVLLGFGLTSACATYTYPGNSTSCLSRSERNDTSLLHSRNLLL